MFLLVDLAFVTASLAKVPQGGWFPLLLGLVLFTLLHAARPPAAARRSGGSSTVPAGLMLAPPPGAGDTVF